MRGARRGAVVLAAAVLCAGLAEASRPALRVYGVADGLKYSQVVLRRRGPRRDDLGRDLLRRLALRRPEVREPHLARRPAARLRERPGGAADGTVWVATQEGLARIAPAAGALGEPRVVPLPPAVRGVASLRPTLLAASPAALWFGDGNRVLRLAEGRLEEVPFPAGFGPTVLALGPATDDACWAGSAGGLALLSRSERRPLSCRFRLASGLPWRSPAAGRTSTSSCGRGLVRLEGERARLRSSPDPGRSGAERPREARRRLGDPDRGERAPARPGGA